MKISCNWLKHYVDLEQSPDEIAAALPLLGFDIESIERAGPPPLDNVVVGEVLDYGKHPNADRLRVCKVSTGDAGEPHTIVCGASNFEAGDRVVVALPGAVLPGDFKIKKSKLRGVESQGMMCSARELQAGEDHDGIMVLGGKPALGTPINELYGEADTVLDVEVTPNRPDCLSHIGIARELAARFETRLSYPDLKASAEKPLADGETPLLDGVAIEAGEDCSHYTAICVRGVEVRESPDWLKRALGAIGLRPINNIVDVTNYVLHETGQPLHAFDAEKIRGRRLVVRRASAGEAITTLDGETRELEPEMAVIADTERPLVVAGVMGSVDAEVDENTRDIVLEAAWFSPSSVRRTSRRLGLASDSSYRFERGVDPGGVDYAALRAVDLIIEAAGGEVSGPMRVAGSAIETVTEVELTPDEIRAQTGFEVTDEEMIAVLESIELAVAVHDTPEGGKRWRVTVPSFRGDVGRPVDVVEEFVRVYGTGRIPDAPVLATGVGGSDHRIYSFNEQAAGLLAGRGFDEAFLYSLREAGEAAAWAGEGADQLRLANPLASDQSHLRPSLLPGLVDVLRLNQARATRGARFFERGRVFRESGGAVRERVAVGFVILDAGEADGWRPREAADYYTAKRLCESLLELAGVGGGGLDFEVPSSGTWQQGHAAVAADPGGRFDLACGLLDLRALKEHGLAQAVVAGEVSFEPELFDQPVGQPRFSAVSLFPPSTKDLALVVDEAVPAETVRRELATIAGEFAGDFELETCSVFDVYRGEGLPAGSKSLAFSLSFRSRERTLKDKEVNSAFDRIQAAIGERTAYTVRG